MLGDQHRQARNALLRLKLARLLGGGHHQLLVALQAGEGRAHAAAAEGRQVAAHRVPLGGGGGARALRPRFQLSAAAFMGTGRGQHAGRERLPPMRSMLRRCNTRPPRRKRGGGGGRAAQAGRWRRVRCRRRWRHAHTRSAAHLALAVLLHKRLQVGILLPAPRLLAAGGEGAVRAAAGWACRGRQGAACTKLAMLAGCGRNQSGAESHS